MFESSVIWRDISTLYHLRRSSANWSITDGDFGAAMVRLVA